MKIMDRGQITIPRKYRDAYGLKPGIEVDFISIDEGLLIKKKNPAENPFRKAFGILKKKKAVTDSYIDEIRGR